MSSPTLFARPTPKTLLTRRGSLVALATLTLIGATSLPATAGVDGTYRKNNVKIRSGPYTSSTLRGQGFLGQDACVFYAATGTTVDGNSTWWYHQNYSTGVEGFSAMVRMALYAPAITCQKV